MAAQSELEPTILAKLPRSARFYLGSDQHGPRFANGGQGHNWRVEETNAISTMGLHPTLALGLTECCAAIGRGKFFFVAKSTYSLDLYRTKDKLSAYNDFIKLPNLLYIDYVWNDARRTEWFHTPHDQRFKALSARNNALSPSVPTLPITVSTDQDNHPDVMIYGGGGMGQACLYWSPDGDCFADFFDVLSQSLTLVQENWNRPLLSGLKTAIAGFRLTSGQDIVTKVHTMYKARRPGGNVLFSEVIDEIVKAHENFVKEGGYSYNLIESRQKNLAEQVEQKIAGGAPNLPVQRLNRLRDDSSSWSPGMKNAKDAFALAADRGLVEVAKYTIDDLDWNALTKEERHTIVEMYELEVECNQRVITRSTRVAFDANLQPDMQARAAAGSLGEKNDDDSDDD